MRKISANYIFPVTSAPLKNGIIVLDDDDQIIDIIDTNGVVKEIQNLEFYSGIIVPGFVDVFTLLSYPSFTTSDYKECLSENFRQSLNLKLKNSSPYSKQIQRGLNHLEAFGTVAAADINPIKDDGIIERVKTTICNINVDSDKFKLDSNITPNSSSSILLNRFTLEGFDINSLDRNQIDNFCIGTGSLGSHTRLSVYDELKEIQQSLSEFTCWDLIKMGTINGARSLELESIFGSLEVGKKPGLNLLTKIDYEQQKLTKESELTILVKP